MRSIIVTSNNRQSLEGGRVAFGQQNFGCRGGSYETYEVRLSTKATTWLEDGDELRWWDDSSELPYIECGGEIVKPDGRRIQLTGSRDVGIDTGHPCHLILKMKTRKGVVWERDSEEGRIVSVVKAPWGTWYKFTDSPPGMWGVKSHEDFMKWASGASVFDGKTQVLSSTRRLNLTTQPEMKGWISGYLTPQRKVVTDVATDEPLILEGA